MGTFWFLLWSVLIIKVQASDLTSADEPACSPGFESNEIIFKVTREQLRLGTRLGKVKVTNCTDLSEFLLISDDSHFMLQTDGTLVVKKPIVLHEGHRDFFIHSWDTQSQKMTDLVRLSIRGNDHGNNKPQNQPTKPDFENSTEMPSQHFHRSNKGLRRTRRSLQVFPVNIAENHRGPFPLLLAQIHTTEDRVKTFKYSITGPGVDQPPEGLFTIDRDTGYLYLTQSLDRETQDKYMFQVHPVEEGSTSAKEAIEIIVNVIDQNDNKPVFSEDIYVGEVAESSPKGSEVMKIEAKDLDEPESHNSDIRYRIVNQEPEEPSPSMFTINPETGVISVSADGFDRKNYPQYTLQVEASDMQGEGLTGSATVNLTVTEPIITTDDEGLKRSRRAVQPEVKTISIPWEGRGPGFPGSFSRHFRSTEGLIRRKRDWIVPPLSVLENHRGPYPLKIGQVRSDEDRHRRIFYSITGPGADQSPVNLFTMNRDNGNLYVTQVLDREKQDRYLLQLHAVAEGSVNAERPMNIIINVIDQNDNKPIFTQSIFEGKVEESSPKGVEVIRIEAFDADEPDSDNSDLRYSILSQNPEFPSRSMFAINPVTGTITVNDGRLLKEKYPQYTLTVQAADLQGEGLSSTTKVIIIVIVPTTSPFISGPKIIFVHPEFSVAENKRGPFPVMLAQIRSVEDKVKKIFYSITGPGADQHPIGLFTVDRDTGILYITQSLDRETQDKYTVQAHAVAEGEGNADEHVDFVVKVIDQNDNKPVFNKNVYVGEVAETSQKGMEVIQVVASDADETNSDNSDIRYRILSQDPQDPFVFAINPTTGVITVNTDGLNREKHSMYTLVVEAADMGGEGLSSQTRVLLIVTANSQASAGGAQSRARRDVQSDAIRIPTPWRERPRAARNSETQSTTSLPAADFDPQQTLPDDRTMEPSTASGSDKTPKHKNITKDPSGRLTTDKKTSLKETKSLKNRMFLLKNSKYKALMLMFYPQLLKH